MKDQMKATQCVHSGRIIDPNTKGMVTPLYPSTAFDYQDIDVPVYPRYFNTPNQKVVVDKLCALENGDAGLLTSSGMSAITSVLFSILKSGDHAIFIGNLYGGTHHAVVNELGKFGVSYSFCKGDESSLKSNIRENTRAIYFETPSNPLLQIIEIRMIARIAKENDITTIIDNTFATPINQTPLDMGIDIVIHSGTKYLGGHSDIICGAVISQKLIIEKVWNTAVNFGGNVNATTAALLERSLKTLSIRVEKQNENALELAVFLENHSKVDIVFYPGLTSHPEHSIASSQMSGYGGMLSFEVITDPQNLGKMLHQMQIIHSSVSLGGVESIISEPVKTSHAKMTRKERKNAGINDRLLRFSVGIEDVEDLKEDLDRMLKNA